MIAGTRLDGHIVQGHVDRTAECVGIENADGSTVLTFQYTVEPDDVKKGYVIVEKGSVAVNGVSLTAYDIDGGRFKVSIIPYTSEVTNLGLLKIGDKVNLEFDILGKYIARMFPGMNENTKN
jgi:riboflavin synthase